MDDLSTSQSTEPIIFRCVNCITDIRGIRFTCKHNDCEEVHLCGECFCMHAEPGKHKKTHPYDIWNEASFKLFTCPEEDQWFCIDEHRLMQAMERYGHGNWPDVAAMVPGKTAKQVEEHYNDFYVDGNIGNVSWKTGGYCSERAIVRDVGIPECSPKQTARNIQLLTNLEVAEMNYMPSRDEFYKEYDNEAEEEISQLVFQDGEDDLDRRMKLALIDGCQRRLQERARRKNVASEFGLLHVFLKHRDAYPGCEGVRLHKGETRFRTEICSNLKLFLQYMTFDELISFLQNLTSQIELKARIRDLCRARKHGVTRLDAMPHFEIARQHREKHLQGKDQDGVEGAELAPEELQVLEKDVDEYPSSRETESGIGSGFNSNDSTDTHLVRAEYVRSRSLLCCYERMN
ncbi:transcriptional adapter 2-beta [Galendromus occidentalis]|uniref:Transcriptional adapter 2-beta n=1 Tax=Galendromus occidentalis TaxID=34638 RepID=A0AAJ7L873_9ACAR|nr:transcriptional adapter 2-beta [Galendromus occidentalis]